MKKRKAEKIKPLHPTDAVRVTPEALNAAWKKYMSLFGQAPHGTVQQCSALLALVPTMRKPGTVGKTLPPETLMMRVGMGDAKGLKTTYELSTNFSNGTPIVLSKQTGRWFVLSWQEIIEMAIERGIDEETKT